MTNRTIAFQKLLDKMRHAAPSRLLDCEVHLVAIGDVPYGRNFWGKQCFLSGYVETYSEVIDADDAIPDDVVPRYTSEFEAAYALLRTADVTMLSLEGSWEPYQPDVHPAWAVRYYTKERPPTEGDKGGWYGAIAAGVAPAIALCRAAMVVLARAQGFTVRAE